MPNLLLFNCDEELVKRLMADGRWSVAMATHAEDYEVSLDTPSPLHWHLILDDCKDDKWPKADVIVPDAAQCHDLGIPIYPISADYLDQATRAHGIRFASAESHWRVRLQSGRRLFRNPEFNHKDDMAKPLEDFVHRFRQHFIPRSYLAWESWDSPTKVYADSYDLPLVVLEATRFGSLVLLDIPDKDIRIDALEYLCIRSAPKLWPDLYAGSFQPSRVKQWLNEKDALAREYSEKQEAIDRNIEEEEKFFAPYINLLYIGNDDLKRLVGRAFHNVFGLQVTDLDDLTEGPKTSDLLLEDPNWKAFVEVSGSTNRNAGMAELDDFDAHFEQLKSGYPDVQKRILVFNGRYGRSDAERAATPVFSGAVRKEAERRGIGLIETQSFLKAIERFHIGRMTKDDFLRSLATPVPSSKED